MYVCVNDPGRIRGIHVGSLLDSSLTMYPCLS